MRKRLVGRIRIAWSMIALAVFVIGQDDAHLWVFHDVRWERTGWDATRLSRKLTIHWLRSK